ncbi:hypothetical protein VPH35_100751 [Triticum aestivum]
MISLGFPTPPGYPALRRPQRSASIFTLTPTPILPPNFPATSPQKFHPSAQPLSPPPPPPTSILAAAPPSAEPLFTSADAPSRRSASSTVEICRDSSCVRLPYTVERHHAVRRPAPRCSVFCADLLAACVGNFLLVLAAGNLICYLNRRQELQPARRLPAELHQPSASSAARSPAPELHRRLQQAARRI